MEQVRHLMSVDDAEGQFRPKNCHDFFLIGNQEVLYIKNRHSPSTQGVNMRKNIKIQGEFLFLFYF